MSSNDPDLEQKAADIIIVTHQPIGQEIHVIADNLSAHKTKRSMTTCSGAGGESRPPQRSCRRQSP